MSKIPLSAVLSEDGQKVVSLDEWPDAQEILTRMETIEADIQAIKADIKIMLKKFNNVDAGYLDVQNSIMKHDARLKALET